MGGGDWVADMTQTQNTSNIMQSCRMPAGPQGLEPEAAGDRSRKTEAISGRTGLQARIPGATWRAILTDPPEAIQVARLHLFCSRLLCEGWLL